MLPWVKEADVQGALRDPAMFWSNAQLGRAGAGESVGESERAGEVGRQWVGGR